MRNSKYLYKVELNPAWKPGHDQSSKAREAAKDNFKLFRLAGVKSVVETCFPEHMKSNKVFVLLYVEHAMDFIKAKYKNNHKCNSPTTSARKSSRRAS